MLPGLLVVVLLAPLHWLLVPARLRRTAVIVASLAFLAAYNPRLPVLVLAVTVILHALLRAITERRFAPRSLLVGAGLTGLAALFVVNKLAGQGAAVLPSQSGLAFLGVSYLVLKAAAALIEAARGSVSAYPFARVLEWIAFLPTYPSGPMEDFEHFRGQTPRFDRARFLGGLERILFGMIKAVVAAHYLGEWSAGVLAAPAGRPAGVLLLGAYAFALRFYLDFAGWSDIAIGAAALYGYDIEENFNNPFLRRNLVQLWQNWHMTLTRWLRSYLFIPITRRLLRRGRGFGDRLAIATGQIASMTFCGLWHGLSWNFALWGLLHALALIWVGVLARDVGRRLPLRLVRWWRESRVAYVLSTAITFNVFALLTVLVVTDVGSAANYWALLVGAR
jgi:alginate O-acetyltransferase complex protein AlgI